jgi:RNA polymerase sigma-70 factor (ECF subfamily)
LWLYIDVSRRAIESPDSAAAGSDAAGDAARAFAEFVRVESAGVLRLARRLVGDREEALDLAQEALTRAFEALHSFRGESSLRTWVHRIVVHESLRRLRRRRLWDRTLGWLLPRSREALADGVPESNLEARILAQELTRALERLPAQQRVVLTLRFQEELSLPEIADLMKIAPGTVKTHLVRALRAVRRDWEKVDEGVHESSESLRSDRGEVGDGSAPSSGRSRTREHV